MMLWSSLLAYFAPLAVATPATVVQTPLLQRPRAAFDIQAHRGGRGEVVESVLPAFAWALINGANTLELDNGITKDGEVIVWHDEDITAAKCIDTAPVVDGDPDYPYVGKVVSQLTLAQIRTLDCGAKRQLEYPLQTTYPGTRISTLSEFFDFVKCTDPDRQMKFNIESKINAVEVNKTRGPEEFVERQYKIFVESSYLNAITYQSFDWRTLALMKERNSNILLSGLVDSETLGEEGSTSDWFAGLQVDDFAGHTRSARLASMAASLGLHILSPADISGLSSTDEITLPGFRLFTDEPMVRRAHKLGMLVKPWSVNKLGVAEKMLELGVDGLITDFPDALRRWAKGRGMPVAPRYPSSRVLSCLNQHRQTVSIPLAPPVNNSQHRPAAPLVRVVPVLSSI